MKKYKRKLMDSGQAAVTTGLLLSKRIQLLIAITLPLCVFLLAQLITFSAQATYTQHQSHTSRHRHHQSNEINQHKHIRCQPHESHSCSRLEAPAHSRHRRHQFGLSRRQALESVVNRLHILESLDEQLRAFSDAAELVQRQQQAAVAANGDQVDDSSSAVVHSSSGHKICQLRLFRSFATESTNIDSCLANKRLLNQIPPYMLNLYRQLLFELHQQQEERTRNATAAASADQLQSASETVQSMMPYNAQIMRSFRQPKISLPATNLDARSNGRDDHDDDRDDYDDSSQEHSSKGAQFGEAIEPNVVVELSSQEPTRSPFEPLDRRHQNNNDWSWPFSSGNTEAPFKWRHSTPAEAQQRARRQQQQQQQVQVPSELACDFRQRLLDASRRDEICFWFNLSENFRMSANKSLEFGIKSTPGDRNQLEEPLDWSSSSGHVDDERLVEAELHVFKLFPQLAPPSPPTTQSLESINRSTSANSFHLKTNLLEVSLYQILPRRRTRQSQPSGGGGGGGGDNQLKREPSNQEQKEQDEFPLRLLDIRRIDLNSNGWETFYVKRAVEDWLRDARLNLGLVIKAKSMFDEPIKVGLIRFADAYDHCCQRPDARSGSHLIDADAAGQAPANDEKLVAASRRRLAKQHEKTLRDFDTSHQPLLVIYTTTTTSGGSTHTLSSR